MATDRQATVIDKEGLLYAGRFRINQRQLNPSQFMFVKTDIGSINPLAFDKSISQREMSDLFSVIPAKGADNKRFRHVFLPQNEKTISASHVQGIAAIIDTQHPDGARVIGAVRMGSGGVGLGAAPGLSVAHMSNSRAGQEALQNLVTNVLDMKYSADGVIGFSQTRSDKSWDTGLPNGFSLAFEPRKLGQGRGDFRVHVGQPRLDADGTVNAGCLSMNAQRARIWANMQSQTALAVPEAMRSPRLGRKGEKNIGYDAQLPPVEMGKGASALEQRKAIDTLYHRSRDVDKVLGGLEILNPLIFNSRNTAHTQLAAHMRETKMATVAPAPSGPWGGIKVNSAAPAETKASPDAKADAPKAPWYKPKAAA